MIQGTLGMGKRTIDRSHAVDLSQQYAQLSQLYITTLRVIQEVGCGYTQLWAILRPGLGTKECDDGNIVTIKHLNVGLVEMNSLGFVRN